MSNKSAKPLTDEQLWGEPDKSAHEGPGRMTQDEIDDRMREETLEEENNNVD